MQLVHLFLTFLFVSLVTCEVEKEVIEDDINDKRIVNGTTAKPEQFPYMVPIYEFDPVNNEWVQYCGACILEEKWILTAAHCVADKTPDEIRFEAGLVDWIFETGQRLYAEKIYVHPNFDLSYPFKWDIALVKLSNSVDFNNRVGTCSLPEPDSDPLDKEVTIMGWGMIDPKRTIRVKELQHANIRLSSQEICKKLYSDEGFYNDDLLCVINRNDTSIGALSGTCVGDSGGPLIQEQDDRSVVIGIVSSVRGDCGMEAAAFTKVSKFVKPFIRPIIGGRDYGRIF